MLLSPRSSRQRTGQPSVGPVLADARAGHARCAAITPTPRPSHGAYDGDLGRCSTCLRSSHQGEQLRAWQKPRRCAHLPPPPTTTTETQRPSRTDLQVRVSVSAPSVASHRRRQPGHISPPQLLGSAADVPVRSGSSCLLLTARTPRQAQAAFRAVAGAEATVGAPHLAAAHSQITLPICMHFTALAS